MVNIHLVHMKTIFKHIGIPIYLSITLYICRERGCLPLYMVLIIRIPTRYSYQLHISKSDTPAICMYVCILASIKAIRLGTQPTLLVSSPQCCSCASII